MNEAKLKVKVNKSDWRKKLFGEKYLCKSKIFIIVKNLMYLKFIWIAQIYRRLKFVNIVSENLMDNKNFNYKNVKYRYNWNRVIH